MKDKYILQYGSLAGWPYKIAVELRRRHIPSVNATVVVKDADDLDRQLPYDYGIYNSQKSRLDYYKKFLYFPRVLAECSLVHYHGGTILDIISHRMLEGPLLHKAKIPMIISFGGGDARIISMSRAKNPFFYRMPDEARDRRTRKWLSSLSRYVRFAATDCEMTEYVAPYFEKVFTFRQPVNLEDHRCQLPDEHNHRPLVLHIPTHPWAKGTTHVENAVERLKAEGLSFEFRMVRQLTQKQVYEEIVACDVYIDELLCGSYGATAVESMASGKPTVTYIREDLVDKYPSDMPLVNANPDTIYTVLKKLILGAGLRHEIGKRSRAYVEKYHTLDVVVSELLNIYKDIGYRGQDGA